MSERLSRAEQLGRALAAGWQREDVEAQLARLHDRRRARRRRRAVAIPLAALAITGGLAAAWSGRDAPAPVVLAVPPPPPPALRDAIVAVPAPAPPPALPGRDPAALTLGDGSVVTPLDQDSRLVARRVSDSEVVVALAGGGARFDVPEHAGRRFQAEVGGVALDTHGAAFRVRIIGRQIEVSAERGELTARWSRQHRLVRPGETQAFPPAARPAANPPAGAGEDGRPPVVAETAWRDAAARGDYAAAWTGLPPAGPLDGMADLLLAGDVARLSGHAAAAIGPLARAIAEHPDDARAPLAAFTLGRVHLEDLGAPRDAAQAFARARELAPAGPLAEDALAREVEAWSRAGETELARVRAQAYLQHYPHGRRAHAVRRFGGVGDP